MQTFTEIFFDEQDPNNGGWAYRFFRRDPAMTGPREDVESGEINDLDGLLYALGHEVEDDRILSDLPTFGGDKPEHMAGVYSWDHDRLLVTDGVGGFKIIDREPQALRDAKAHAAATGCDWRFQYVLDNGWDYDSIRETGKHGPSDYDVDALGVAAARSLAEWCHENSDYVVVSFDAGRDPHVYMCDDLEGAQNTARQLADEDESERVWCDANAWHEHEGMDPIGGYDLTDREGAGIVIFRK